MKISMWIASEKTLWHSSISINCNNTILFSKYHPYLFLCSYISFSNMKYCNFFSSTVSCNKTFAMVLQDNNNFLWQCISLTLCVFWVLCFPFNIFNRQVEIRIAKLHNSNEKVMSCFPRGESPEGLFCWNCIEIWKPVPLSLWKD